MAGKSATILNPTTSLTILIKGLSNGSKVLFSCLHKSASLFLQEQCQRLFWVLCLFLHQSTSSNTIYLQSNKYHLVLIFLHNGRILFRFSSKSFRLQKHRISYTKCVLIYRTLLIITSYSLTYVSLGYEK